MNYIMKEIYNMLNSKTTFCKHQNGCIISALKMAIKNLKYGLIISFALQLIKTFKAVIKKPSNAMSSFHLQYFTIALFLSTIVFVLRLVKCILRRIRDKDDGWNSLLAGAVGGWVATKTLSKEYWYFYLTFIGSRIIGAFHKYLMEKQILNKQNSHWHSSFMMIVAHTIHSYGYFIHPFILKDDIYGLYHKMSAQTPNEKKWHLSSLSYNHRRIKEIFGPMPQFDKITESKMAYLKQNILKDSCTHK